MNPKELKWTLENSGELKKLKGSYLSIVAARFPPKSYNF